MATASWKIAGAAALLLTGSAWAGPAPALDAGQSRIFRSWFVRIVKEQLRQGPSPRWVDRDCAGLVRFAVHESLRTHDAPWLKANGLEASSLPPEIGLEGLSPSLVGQWKLDGSGARGPFVAAIGIIQDNSEFVSKDVNQAMPGDLLFFDQGEDQHLMIWMGSYAAYHPGGGAARLKTARVDELMNWTDTRWQPRTDNPNFIGVYRFSFLSR